MFKVLLVDDEKLERESISELIDWESHYIDFIGAAKNGIEAYDMIKEKMPEIVITDIKMPVVSGLDLIEKVKKDYPDIVFVVLSGYGDYEYTSKAMLFGVRHYLLKPITEDKILEVLANVENELIKKEEEKKIVDNLKGNLEKVFPHVKQQFLRESSITGIHNKNDSDYYKELFGIDGNTFRIVLFNIESKCDFIDKFALKNIAEEIIDTVRLGTIIESNVVLLIDAGELRKLTDGLTEVQKKYMEYFNSALSISVSDADEFEKIHQMYEQATEQLRRRFELPENRLVTSQAFIESGLRKSMDISKDIELIYSLVKNGNINDLNYRLEIFLTKMKKDKLKITEVKKYCIKLLKAVLNLSDEPIQSHYSEKAAQIEALEETDKIYDVIKAVCNEIAGMNVKNQIRNRNPFIEATIKCIYENISNPQLSLNWIAHEILFMNEEYLGRLFFKEMNEKFSQYVLKTRIEMAKKLIENTDYLKIYEISRMTGFSEDAQYFSRMFKNYTDCTPSEYKKKIEKSQQGQLNP